MVNLNSLTFCQEKRSTSFQHLSWHAKMSFPHVTQPPGKSVGRLLEPEAGVLCVLLLCIPAYSFWSFWKSRRGEVHQSGTLVMVGTCISPNRPRQTPMPACPVRYYVMGGVGLRRVSSPGSALDTEGYGPACLIINTHVATC